MSVLAQSEIIRLLNSQPPLLEGYVDLARQIQPNGFDLTLREIAILQTPGLIDRENQRRVISESSRLIFDGLGYVNLVSGPYLITFNEIIRLPRHIMALGKPRSSLLRCGVAIHNAVWDAGYNGRSQALLVVYNGQGFRLQQNARVLQLVFLQLIGGTEGYQGIFQQENL